MGCCSTGKTNTPPFVYSASSKPLPKEKQTSARYEIMEGPKTQGYLSSISCLGNSNNSIRNIACGWGKSLVLYDLDTCKLTNQFQPHLQNISKCRLFNNSESILTSSYDTTLKLWNMENLSMPKKTYQGHEMAVVTFCISKDEKFICSGSKDQTVALWDISTGQKISDKGIPRNTITCMEWIPNSDNNFVQCSEDLTVRIWDKREMKPITEVQLKDNYFAYCCDIDENGTKLLTGHYSCNEEGSGVLLWDLRKINETGYIWRYLEHKESVVAVKFIKHTKINCEIAVSAGKDAKLKIIKTQDGLELGGYQDELRWPFSTFSEIKGKEGEPIIVAAMCKNAVSRVAQLKIGNDYSVSMVAGTEIAQDQ